MKEVISNEALREKMQEAIDLLCDSVSSTLGPAGNNVLIDSDEASPYITNDGVTIARNIESSDKAINTILEIAKEASLKTDEEVGDGTTTTLVLLKAIFNEGLKEIKKGINPIFLKKELIKKLDDIILEIEKEKKEPTENDLINIASISANDVEIGKLLTEIYLKMKSKYAIKLEESKTSKTYYEIKTGYSLEIDNISNLYFKENDEIVLDKVNLLVIDDYLEDLESISEFINESINGNKNLLILAKDYNELLEREVLIYYLEEHKNIFLFRIPDYGLKTEFVLEDIKVLSNANINNYTFNGLGFINKIIISKNGITLINDINLTTHIEKVKKELKSANDYDKEFILERLSKLENGIATIYVGGNTRSEIKEKMMRCTDALCSLETAMNGIVIGEGITFLKIAYDLDDKDINTKIFKNALSIPFRKIMENEGLENERIETEIINNNFTKAYNFTLNRFETITETRIIDPKDVLIKALKNATSIAVLLLTTNYLVINNNPKKTNILEI